MPNTPQDTPGPNTEAGVSAFDAAFGRHVRQIREANQLTQRQLAALMTAAGHSMYQTTIAKIEAGTRPAPSAKRPPWPACSASTSPT